MMYGTLHDTDFQSRLDLAINARINLCSEARQQIERLRDRAASRTEETKRRFKSVRDAGLRTARSEKGRIKLTAECSFQIKQTSSQISRLTDREIRALQSNIRGWQEEIRYLQNPWVNWRRDNCFNQCFYSKKIKMQRLISELKVP